MEDDKQKYEKYFMRHKIELLSKIKMRAQELNEQCSQLLLVAEYENVMRPRVWAELKTCCGPDKVGSIIAREQALFKSLAMNVSELQAALPEPLDLSDDLCSKMWRVRTQIENYSSIPEYIRTCAMPTDEDDRRHAKEAIQSMWPANHPMSEEMKANWRK